MKGWVVKSIMYNVHCTLYIVVQFVHEYQKVGKGGKVGASGSATVVKAWRIVGKKVRTVLILIKL